MCFVQFRFYQTEHANLVKAPLLFAFRKKQMACSCNTKVKSVPPYIVISIQCFSPFRNA